VKLDLRRARFANEGHGLAQEILEEARAMIEENPEKAAAQLAIAWGVVNAAAMVAADSGMHTKRSKIETIRNKIRLASGELVSKGYMPTTMPFDGQIAFTVAPITKVPEKESKAPSHLKIVQNEKESEND
jgi:hypothetical protein